jgi:hypothetical protein
LCSAAAKGSPSQPAAAFIICVLFQFCISIHLFRRQRQTAHACHRFYVNPEKRAGVQKMTETAEKNTYVVFLSQGKFALIDEEDLEKISKHKWHAKKKVESGKAIWYAARNEYSRETQKCKTVLMHNEILGGLFVDHINHNGLDNRRYNLRFATRRQNGQNRLPNRNGSSKYKGVSITKYKKWIARIRVNGKAIWLGTFDTEIEAAQAYDLAAIEHFGTFARINEYSREELESGQI